MRRSKPLQRAIKLREWTRCACDLNDFPEIARLNRLADAAYLDLTPEEALAYREWVWEAPTGEQLDDRAMLDAIFEEDG
jgi:hypothetical protein